MPTYFSTNDGNFSTGLATAVREVSGGTTGLIVTTTNSFAATALSPGATYTGVALQLSAVSGSPAGTIDLTLSGNNGTQTSGSFPVSGLTQLRSVSIAPTTPVSWQYFSFDTPITFASGVAMTIGVKTSVASKVSLMGTTNLQNLNRAYVTDTVSTPNNALDSVHIVGTLSSNGVIPRTVNYDVATVNVLGNLYVHNKGTLNFDPSINIDLTLSGGLGFQITQEGTVNIGTSSNNVQSDKLHNIKFSSAYLNVHNGATFNAYGAYKTPYALLNADTVVGADAYPLVTDVSNWTANNSNSALADSVVICPNTSLFSTTETSSVKTKNIDGTLTVWTTAAFAHDSSDYIPSVLNMTRNVRLSGGNFYARFLDGSVTNLNNVQFNGLRNTAQKGLQFCTNSTGSVSLSNCAFNGSNLASTPAFSFIATKTPAWNVSIKGCNFSGYGATTDIITLDSVSANNFTFTDNIVVDSSQNGMFINALSSTYANIKNNFLIGNTQNGLRVVNPYLVSGSIGGIGCINGICGSVVAGTNNRANYDGLAGHYNTKEGVNILGTIPYRPVLLVISPGVFQFKTLRQVIVYLHSAQLPAATNSIAHHEVELGAVEGSLAIFYHRLESLFLGHLLDTALCCFPVGIRTNVLRGITGITKGNLRQEVGEIQRLEDVQHQVNHLPYFFFHLIDGAENMRIVLGETTHTSESV